MKCKLKFPLPFPLRAGDSRNRPSHAPRKLFVTTALPYANGPFHIGHIMEYIQADIWVRFQRMQGHEVHFVGADDAHGAPIMLAAEKAGQDAGGVRRRDRQRGRKQYLDGFHIAFDNWHSTHSPENTELSQDIYRRLEGAGLIYTKPVEQFFDPVKGMFLADRYIKGECPNCGAKDQYGDACENCSTRLLAHRAEEPLFDAVRRHAGAASPRSTISSSCPIRSAGASSRNGSNTPGRLQPQVVNKAREWLEGERRQGAGRLGHLARRALLRHPHPRHRRGEVLLRLAGRAGRLPRQPEELLRASKGLDFDALPAGPADRAGPLHRQGHHLLPHPVLAGDAEVRRATYKVPDHVYVHGFITVSGEKMSKSRGTGISPLRYLDLGMNPEWLRYYIAAKLNANVEDIDFNPDDFIARVNSDLIGKYVNIASRCAGFISQAVRRQAADAGAHPLVAQLPARAAPGASPRVYEQREFGKALREIMALADRVNQYVDAEQALGAGQGRRRETAELQRGLLGRHERCSGC